MGLIDFVPIIGTVLEKIFPDPTKAAEAKLELLRLTQAGELAELDADVKLAIAQTDINKEEAKSTNVWVSGWRPAVGWICGAAFGYAAILEPAARFIASVGYGYTGQFPAIDTDLTMQVLLGILGLGGMRSFEKHKGVASK